MTTHSQYDEITFALYYDCELGQEEADEFELALDQDSNLAQAYDAWVDQFEQIAHVIQTEEQAYELDGFSNRVMDALPQVSWSKAKPQAKVETELNQDLTQAWWSAWLKPILIGGLSAAAILLIARSLETQSTSPQRSTVLINQQESNNQAPVIWLLDEEESIEDLDSTQNEDTDSQPEEDI